MPITYTIDGAQGLVTLRYTGSIGDADLIETFTRLYSDPQHRVGMSELSDCRGVEQLTATAKGMQRLADVTAMLLDGARTPWKVAIVAARDEVYGVARMYQQMREDSPEFVHVFRQLSDAERWLGAAAPASDRQGEG